MPDPVIMAATTTFGPIIMGTASTTFGPITMRKGTGKRWDEQLPCFRDEYLDCLRDEQP
jgi:hypothetical protein